MKLHGALLNPQIMYYSTPMFQLIGVENADVIAVAVGVAFSAAGLASVSHPPLLSLTLLLPPTHPFSLPPSLSLPLSPLPHLTSSPPPLLPLHNTSTDRLPDPHSSPPPLTPPHTSHPPTPSPPPISSRRCEAVMLTLSLKRQSQMSTISPTTS